MTPEERAARQKRRDDQTCADLLNVLWKIRAHLHGETQIGSARGDQ